MLEQSVDGSLNGIGKMVESAPCKPDPEERLQHTRKMLAYCDEAEEMVLKLSESRINIMMNEIEVIGSIRCQYLRWKNEESRWLAEIDASDD